MMKVFLAAKAALKVVMSVSQSVCPLVPKCKKKPSKAQ